MEISGFIGGILPKDSALNKSLNGKPFKEIHSLEDRKKEFDKLHQKYPDRIPVIVEKYSKCKNAPDIDKKKYLVPLDLTFGQFMYVVRKRLKLDADKALYFFCNDTLVPNNILMSHLHKDSAEKCGFLFVNYSSESTFGYGKN